MDTEYPNPCPECQAEWVVFFGGNDAGLLHNFNCSYWNRNKEVDNKDEVG